MDGEKSVASFPWEIRVSQSTFLGFGPDTQMKCERMVPGFISSYNTSQINFITLFVSSTCSQTNIIFTCV